MAFFMTGITQLKTLFTPTIQKKIAKLTKIKLDSGEQREEGQGGPQSSAVFSRTTTATATRTSKKRQVY